MNNFNIADDPFLVRSCPAEAVRIHVVYCHLSRGSEYWNVRNNIAPFWRLYWNPTPGASVIFDKKEYQLSPSTVLLIAPETSFDKSATKPVEHFHLHFFAGAIFDAAITRKIFPISLQPQIKTSMNQIIDLLVHDTLDALFMANCAMVATWALCEAQRQLPSATIVDERINRVQGIIASKKTTIITNGELARAAGMNVNAFIRYFKQRTGHTPQNYINTRRIDYACSLLHLAELSIERVAEQCGFCDRNYFTAVFARLKGMGPAAYRKRIR